MLSAIFFHNQIYDMKNSVLLNICIVAYILACAGCGGRSAHDTAVDTSLASNIEIDVENASPFLLSEVADSVWYLSLESKPESVFGSADKILFTEEMVVIVDRRVSAGVFIFAHDGSYLGNITNRGRGPEEYISLEDVTIDVDNNHIILYDAPNQALHLFDFQGNYVKRHNVDVVFDFFEYLTEGMVICYNTYVVNPDFPAIRDASVFTFSYIDHKDAIALLTFPDDIGLHHKTPLIFNNISGAGDGAYIYDYYTNTIYHYCVDGGLYVKWVLDFGKYNIPEAGWASDDNRLVSDGILSERYVGGLSSFQVTSDWIIGSVEYGRSPSTFIYNSRDEEVFFTTSMITNDLTPDFPNIASFPIALMPPYHSDGAHIVSVYDPMLVVNIIESVKRESEEYGFTFELPVELSNITMESNPVLQFVRLKSR